MFSEDFDQLFDSFCLRKRSFGFIESEEPSSSDLSNQFEGGSLYLLLQCRKAREEGLEFQSPQDLTQDLRVEPPVTQAFQTKQKKEDNFNISTDSSISSENWSLCSEDETPNPRSNIFPTKQNKRLKISFPNSETNPSYVKAAGYSSNPSRSNSNSGSNRFSESEQQSASDRNSGSKGSNFNSSEFDKVFHSDSESSKDQSDEEANPSDESSSETPQLAEEAELSSEPKELLLQMCNKVVQCQEINKEQLEHCSEIFFTKPDGSEASDVSCLSVFLRLIESKFLGSKSPPLPEEAPKNYERLAARINNYINNPKLLKKEKKKKNEDFYKKTLKGFLKSLLKEDSKDGRVTKAEKARKVYLKYYSKEIENLMNKHKQEPSRYLKVVGLEKKIELSSLERNPEFDFHLNNEKEVIFIKIYFNWNK